jgi:hypothetical protein
MKRYYAAISPQGVTSQGYDAEIHFIRAEGAIETELR